MESVSTSPHPMRDMLSPSPAHVPLPPSLPGSRRGSNSSPRDRTSSGLPTLVSVSPRSLLRPRLDRAGLTSANVGGGSYVMNSFMGPSEDPFWEGATITVNQPVGSLSISPNSRNVCLASRKGLYILDLKNLETAPRFVPQGGTWQIADCQWSPHAVTDNLILSTSSQKLLVWDLAAQVALYRSIDAHERAITDINWHALDPNLMATVGMDAAIRGWDMRTDMSRPSMRLSAWGIAGTQVKWNRRAEHVLASAHGNEVIVWDDRKGSLPLACLKAHDAKIYGIDWDRREASKIVTCSLDKTIKQWQIPQLGSSSGDDASDPYTTEIISTNYAVWRARNLPFGHGVLALPQRGETALEMFGLNNKTDAAITTPIERFEGSADVVKEFVWRTRGGNDPDHDDRDFQLVTWSKDRKLRVWPVPREVAEKVGYKRGGPVTVLLSRKGARDVTFTDNPGTGANTARMQCPIVDHHTPVAPSGIARQRLLATSRAAAGMTRGGGQTGKNEIDQIDWLTKVVKTGRGLPNSEGSTGPPSRAPSVGAEDFVKPSGSRSRSRSRLAHDAIRPLSFNRAPSMTRMGSANDTTSSSGAPEAMDLKHEVLLVRKMFPKSKVNFEKVDLNQHKLTMSLNGPWANGDRFAFIRIHWSFPANYPYGSEIPTFELERNVTISPITRHRMVSTIKDIRSANKQCLVSVTEFLLGYHERTGRRVLDDESASDSDAPVLQQNVPMLIRNTGAVFGPNGQLACFFPKHTVLPRARTSLSRSPSGRQDSLHAPLARAISALSRMENPNKPTTMRYRRHVRRLKAMMAPVQARSTLTLHNVSHLLGEPDMALATLYSTTSVDANLVHALEAKRLDHAEVWASLRALLVDPPPPYSDHPPLHRELTARAERLRWERDMERKRCVLDEVFARLMDAGDIQMLALVSCLLLEYERTAPEPPQNISEVHHSPQQDYFVLPATTGPSAPTPLTVGRRHSSITPTTPPIPSSNPSSFRTSGWSQILMNPSSISLRGMALTPRDRTSFDMSPAPKEESDDNTSPLAARSIPSGRTALRQDSITSSGVGSVPAEGPSPRRASRRDSQRQSRDPRPRPLNSPNNLSSLPPLQTHVTSSGGLMSARDRSGSSEGFSGASGWSAVGTRPKVSFGSSSPLRLAFSRAGPPAPLPHLPERRRRQQTCSIRIDLIADTEPPPSLLRPEFLPLAEVWKLTYADFLFRGGLIGRRTALLQYSFAPIDAGNTGRNPDAPSADLGMQGLTLATVCTHCNAAVVMLDKTVCDNCEAQQGKPLCSVCRIPIKGLATTCTVCSHTSHTRCLRVALASVTDHCPSCTCHCLAVRGISGSFPTAAPRDRNATLAPPVSYGFAPPVHRFQSFSTSGLNLTGMERRASQSPTGFTFDGPHMTTSPEPHHRRSTSALEIETNEVQPEPERPPSPPRPPPREGLLARSRLRALGTEGLLGW